MSLVVNKAKLMEIINEELQKVVAEGAFGGAAGPGTPEYEKHQAALRGEEPEESPPEAPARPIKWPGPQGPEISSTGQVALPLKSKTPAGALQHSTILQIPEPTGVRKTGHTVTADANAPTVAMPGATSAMPGGQAPKDRPPGSAVMVGTPDQWVKGFKKDAQFAQAVLDEFPGGDIELLKLLAQPGGADKAKELVRAAKADAQKPMGRFKSLLQRLVSEELELYLQEIQEQQLKEVYSDKQRRWACAQASKPAGKRKKSLSKKEADEMCKGPKLKPKKKGKKK